MYSLPNTHSGALKNVRAVGAPINFLMAHCVMPLMNGLALMRAVRADDDLVKPVRVVKCGDHNVGQQ
jgi:hypothetical protein